MSPAASGDGASLSRSEIEDWDTSCLDAAATAWRLAAAQSEAAFDQHRQDIASPGGTTWEGDAKDAAMDRVMADVVVVGRQGEVLREAADIAENGRHGINAAQSEAMAAIAATEDDGFSVAEDLSVTDTKRVDFFSMRARQILLNEHAEEIHWYAERLARADSFVGERLQAKAAELDGIRFDGENQGHSGHVQLVDNRFKLDPQGGGQPAPDPAPRVRGLPPPGVHPPVEGPLTEGPASRARERRFGGRSLWDERGGEWRYAPEDDHHNPHWDYNPHSTPSGRGSDWENVPVGGLPPRKGDNPVISALPPWLQSPAVQGVPVPSQNPLLAPFPGASLPAATPAAPPVSPPAAGPGLMPHVHIPAPNPGDLQNAGQVAAVGGGGLLLALLGALVLG